MRLIHLLGLILSFLVSSNLYAQTFTEWGFKGGLTLGLQQWNGLDRNALPSYHGALTTDFLGEWKTYKEGGKLRRYGFFMQLGYHRKGSAVRVNYIPDPNQPNSVVRDLLTNEFHNIAFVLGGKGIVKAGENAGVYYGLGLRLDVTAGFKLLTPNLEPYVNRLNYGVWLGGGMEWHLGKNTLFLEANVSPDLSRQIFVPAAIPIVYYDSSGNQQTLPGQEQKVINMIFEISLGMRFGPSLD